MLPGKGSTPPSSFSSQLKLQAALRPARNSLVSLLCRRQCTHHTWFLSERPWRASRPLLTSKKV